jgi:hypothetical protein
VRKDLQSENRDMSIWTSLSRSLVLGIAVAVATLAQAAAFTIPGSQLPTEGLGQMVRMHHHMHGHHQMMSKGAGRCGENMYFKKGHCMDARDKA